MKRVLGNILALISLFLLPFWCTVVICIVLSFVFDYVEIIFFGFLFDVLYGTPGTFLETNIFTIGSVVLYSMIYFIKPYLKL